MSNKPLIRLDSLLAAQIEDSVELIETKRLHFSKLQPRKYFDQEKIQDLAKRLRTSGVLSPLLVREDDDGLEILCGERRWRAACLAGLDHVPVRRIDCDDATAFRIAVEDNEDREPLNCIEQAQAWQQAIKLRIYGPKAKDLAARLGINAATLSNRLAVLKLPEHWQGVLARGQWGLTATHSRPLLQWVHRKVVLDAMWDRLCGNADKSLSVLELTEQLEDIVLNASRLAEPGEWGRKGAGGYLCCLTDDECERKDLDTEIVTIRGQSIRVAWNVELWEQLNSEGMTRSTKPEPDEPPKETSRKKNDSQFRDGVGKLKPTRSLFPDQDPDATKEQLQTFVKQLLHTAIASCLDKSPSALTNHARRSVVLLALMASFEQPVLGAKYHLEGAARAARGVDASNVARGFMNPSIKDSVVLNALDVFVMDILAEHEANIDIYEMRSLAIACGVTAADGWICDRTFLEMLSLSQLQQVATEWRIKIPADKAGAIEAISSSTKSRPYPKLLRMTIDA